MKGPSKFIPCTQAIDRVILGTEGQVLSFEGMTDVCCIPQQYWRISDRRDEPDRKIASSLAETCYAVFTIVRH
jgi:hypothetical protein